MKRPSRLKKMRPGVKPRQKRVHGHLVSLFAVAAAFLLALNVAVILTPIHDVDASGSDNVTGWAWSDTGGWLSMNDLNTGSGGGTYGVNIATGATKWVTGWAWSSNQGWVCYGTSCTGTAPSGVAASAWVDATNKLRGWAKLEALGASGWISLNCLDTGGAGSCASSNYGVTVNFGAGTFSGFSWHGLSGGAGWGWIDFSGVRVNPGEACHDGIDNNLNGLVDCADLSCKQMPAAPTFCPAVETQCALIGQINCCADGQDDDNDGLIDCADVADCSAAPQCQPEVCGNGMDDNLNGQTDCADIACAFAPICNPESCSNLFDDDADGQIDCADSDCNGFPACTPAWIKAQFGNVYAQQGVGGNVPPPGQSNATYCITSAGTISNFTSGSSCIEPGKESLNLPSGGNGYVTNLGKLDVTGILAGRYGTVVTINSQTDIPAVLGGNIYVYDRDAHGGVCPSGNDFLLGSRVFQNASGANAKGNGLLVIKGCNLKITNVLDYQATGVSQYLRNLASFGVLVLSKYTAGVPTGGNVYIDPTVAKIIGIYFAEQSIHTGTTGATDIQLQVYGALVSHDIKLERRFGSATQAAEDVIFDGRAVVNPPPGTQDITKSLPSVKDTF